MASVWRHYRAACEDGGRGDGAAGDGASAGGGNGMAMRGGVAGGASFHWHEARGGEASAFAKRASLSLPRPSCFFSRYVACRHAEMAAGAISMQRLGRGAV